MLEMKRLALGRQPRRRRALRPSHSPSASRASITWPTISPAVRLRTSRIVPVWQNEQLSVQPTWLDTHSVPRSVSGMNTTRSRAAASSRRKPQQPLAGAVGRHLLRHHLRTRQGEALRQAPRAGPWTRWSWRRSRARRARRANAKAAARASCAASRARPPGRAHRQAPRASGRPAMVSPARRSAQAALFRAEDFDSRAVMAL